MESIFKKAHYTLNINLGKNYNFSIETSNDLDTWTLKSNITGNGNSVNYNLSPSTLNTTAISVTGNENDYGIKYVDGETAYRINNTELIVGSPDPWDNVVGGDAVLIFEIPIKETALQINRIELKFTARKKIQAPGTQIWNARPLSFRNQKQITPFIQLNNSDIKLINDNILDPGFPNTDTIVTSNCEDLLAFIEGILPRTTELLWRKVCFFKIHS